MSEVFQHQPVLLDEVVEHFRPVPPGVIVDATVGGGGHARALLDALPHHALVGLDRDADALSAAATTLAGLEDRVILRQARFDHIDTILQELGHERVAGVLLDLGVSSPQLDRSERGFSYRADGPLDMRMDRSQAMSADDVVNGYDEHRLAGVIRDHGDERFATRIARAIVSQRPIRGTEQLADVVRDAIPAPARRRGGHPAKRTFQAIRMEVNGELDVLPRAIDKGVALLAPGGRIVAIAYHSGEDRIVKARLRDAATGGCVCPPGLPCSCGAAPTVRLVKRGAIKPSAAEVVTNRRAESARMRVAERLPYAIEAATDPDRGGDAA
jgi:16S rRNA (cytosine1402-N4)-methyltransferase